MQLQIYEHVWIKAVDIKRPSAGLLHKECGGHALGGGHVPEFSLTFVTRRNPRHMSALYRRFALVRRIPISCLVLSSMVPFVAGAQDGKNLLGFTIGGEFLPSNALAVASGNGTKEIVNSSSMSLELNYGREVHSFRHSELWLDVPALVGPNHRLTNGNALLPTSNATFYVTPSARLAFPLGHALTPWISAGGGYGLFETSDRLFGGASNPTR